MLAHNLPYQITPFVGRSEEIADIVARLRNPECRLLNLIGPGGIGKTRLAIEVARNVDDFSDGVYFVPLQPLSAPEQVILAIAQALQYELASADNPIDQVFRYLASKRLLLILDNFDHLLAGAATISALLLNAPDVAILATSRERLNLREEWIVEVHGLKWSESNITDVDAVQLFAQTARRVKPGFSLNDASYEINKICQLVEGMPLAIELAASWVQRVPLQTILDEIEAGLDIFESRSLNMTDRHRSMRATIGYSWRSLKVAEQQILKKLAVFRGGFQLEAAQAVVKTSAWELATLVDKSLLRIDTEGRYDLHELIRQYAEEELNASVEVKEKTHHSHCKYYLEYLAQRSMYLIRGVATIKALKEIEIEIDNIRVSWDWAIPRIEVYLSHVDSAAEAIASFYDIRCWNQEADALLSRLAIVLDTEEINKEKPLLIASVLTSLSTFVLNGGHFDEAKRLLKRSLETSRQKEALKEIGNCLLRLAEVNYIANTLAEGQPFVEEGLAVFTKIGNDSGRAQMLGYLGWWYHSYRDHTRARQLLEESVALYQKIEGTAVNGMIYYMLASVLVDVEEYVQAQHFAQESLRLGELVNWHQGITLALSPLAESLYRNGYTVLSLEYARRALRLSLELRRMHLIANTMIACSHILALQEQHEQALEVFSLTRHHPATLGDGLVSIDRGLRELETSLSTNQYTKILDRSQNGDLESTARDLLRDWDHRMKPPDHQPVTDVLTRRELDVLRLVAGGLTNPQIADELVFTVGTVKWYLHQIYTKLEVGNRTQAVTRAREMNLLR